MLAIVVKFLYFLSVFLSVCYSFFSMGHVPEINGDDDDDNLSCRVYINCIYCRMKEFLMTLIQLTKLCATVLNIVRLIHACLSKKAWLQVYATDIFYTG